MNVFVKGKGSVNLSKNDFVGQGGEGSVYAKGGLAYKIYINPKQMIPIGKIQELSVITDPHVNKPQNIITNSNGKHIGYTTTFIKRALPLCSMFPKAFRQRNGIEPEDVVKLVQRMREMVHNVHKANCLIVDLNEMNFLIDSKFTTVYGIDVDSYQTSHFKATALMESIRDRHSVKNTFNQGTDWFAFAITSFQMFRGIHPYKGKHPNVKGLDARMQKNISVFHKDVKVPKAVLPIDVVPQAYIDWYRAVLDDGKRIPPPANMQNVVIITPTLRTITGSGNIKITEFPTRIDNTILGVYFSHGYMSVVANNGKENIIYNNGRPGRRLVPAKHKVIFIEKTNSPVIAWRENGELKLANGVTNDAINIDINVDTIVEHNGRLLVKSSDKIFEINLTKVGDNIMATSNVVGHVLPKASRLYSGVAVQNMLGTPFVSIFPDKRLCYQLKAPELSNYKIIDAKFDGGVMMIVGVKNNQYDRLVFRFDSNYTKYDVRIVEDVTYSGLNFITLDTGICVCINEDEKIEAFSSKIGSSKIKLIEDTALDGDMRLFKMGGQVGFFRDKKIYSMSMSGK